MFRPCMDLFTFVNMQMGFLTPPYGFTLFYIKGVAPKGVTNGGYLTFGMALRVASGRGLGRCHDIP